MPGLSVAGAVAAVMGAAVAVAAVVDDTGAVADSLAAVVTTGSGATGSRPQATDTAAAKRKESPTSFNPPNTLFMEYPFQPIDFVLITYDCSTVATCAIRAVAGVSGPLALRGAPAHPELAEGSLVIARSASDVAISMPQPTVIALTSSRLPRCARNDKVGTCEDCHALPTPCGNAAVPGVAPTPHAVSASVNPGDPAASGINRRTRTTAPGLMGP